MTKEEALKILKQRDNYGIPTGCSGGLAEAIEIAIQALEQEDLSPLQAAQIIKDYCLSMPTDCRDCVFNKLSSCMLHLSDCLPETWEIGNNRSDGYD